MSLHFREAGPAEGPVALLVHGYPNSSYLWREQLPTIAEAGWRAMAPDLPGYGDSPLDGPGDWDHHVEALGAFVDEHALAPVVLVAHDWGGLIGLRWACENPDAVRGLVLSNTGFFPDGRWHGLALAMRTPGDGEELMRAMTRDALAAALRSASPRVTDEAIDEYWKGYADEERRMAQLALYRSGDFERLEAYEGCLGGLGVPTLALWGAEDQFAPVAGAHRFAREIPDTRVVALEGVGHFLQEDAPERVAEEIAGFLRSLG